MHRPFRITAFLIAGLLLAACAPASLAPDESEAASLPSEAPAESSGDGTGSSFVPGAGDLDGILPDSVGGITLEYEYAEGQAVLGSEGVTPEVQTFFDRIGANVGNLSSAIGSGFDEASGDIIFILAFRVAGSDEGRLRDGFRTVLEEEDPDQVFVEDNIAGKNVLGYGAADEPTPSGYMYVKNDVVFLIGASTPELTEEVLSLLP